MKKVAHCGALLMALLKSLPDTPTLRFKRGRRELLAVATSEGCSGRSQAGQR
jgi:hypothetical protein